jgi:hypothetical protein
MACNFEAFFEARQFGFREIFHTGTMPQGTQGYKG